MLQSCGTPECKPSWLSEPSDLGAYPLGSSHKSCGTRHISSFQRDADDLVYHWSRPEGEGGGSVHQLAQLWERVQSEELGGLLIRSWTPSQQFGNYAVKLLSGKDWEMDIFPGFLCTEPRQTATMSALCLLRTASLFAKVLWDSGTQAPYALGAKCLGSLSLGVGAMGGT